MKLERGNIAVFLLLLAAATAARAHDLVTTRLTWSAEISRIVYKRCGGCHREGGIAPMALVSYDVARPWAKAIRDEVLSRRMPPWGAVKGYGEFQDDPSLTQDEINRIAEWVEGGAPEGDPKFLPVSLPASAEARPLPDGIRTRDLDLQQDSIVLAISPLSDVREAKVTALTPDGEMIPMLWLFEYRQSPPFVYRQPMRLPSGTRIFARPAFPLEIIVQRPMSQRLKKRN